MEDVIKRFLSLEPVLTYGYGYGDGSGDGSGYGSGYGLKKSAEEVLKLNYSHYKKGFLNKQIASFKVFDKKPVYYVDNIPCIFLSVLNNIAKVLVIQDDFSTKKCYIAKSGNLFAHGDTKDQAIQSVNDKFYASLSFEEKKQEFINQFKADVLYSNQLFFEWHHHLTGSCETGRKMFVSSHGIDLNSEMTTVQFLNMTKNEYNGSVIAEILQSYS